MKIIDLHTHEIKVNDYLQILNIFAQDLENNIPEGLFSAGIHPWHVDTVNLEQCFRMIRSVSEMKGLLLIGECGLDRSVFVDFAIQEYCFKEHIRIAEYYSKPLIIHCVRAYSDLIRIKKETKSKVPWIIHGFYGNIQVAQQLISHGYYFSLSESLLKSKFAHEILNIIPMDRMFFETDNCDSSVLENYQLAAQVLRIDQETLIGAVFMNFIKIFGFSDIYK